MDWNQLQAYVLPGLVIGYLVWRVLRFRATKKVLPKLLQEGAVIVDVRSPSEFASASNPRSVNIPLNELEKGVGKLDPGKPVIVCCASGTRSGMAVAVLKGKGFSKVLNAGPWQNTIMT